jgi:hypothetical protein
MYLNSNGEIVYSPSDLIRFVQSPFACWMERLRLVRPDVAVRDEPSEELLLIAKTGELHEAAYLQSLRDANHDICEITGDRHHAGTATLRAISDQREIIFQSYLSLLGLHSISDAGANHLGRFRGETLYLDLKGIPRSAATILRKTLGKRIKAFH